MYAMLLIIAHGGGIQPICLKIAIADDSSFEMCGKNTYIGHTTVGLTCVSQLDGNAVMAYTSIAQFIYIKYRFSYSSSDGG